VVTEGRPDDGGPTEVPGLDALLADPLVWEEPDPALEDAVVAAITAEAKDEVGARRRADRAPRTWVRPFLAGAAAAAVVAVLVVGGAALTGASGEDRSGTEVALAGTEQAPEASADALVADTSLGTVLHLDVRGLDPAPDGTYYEAWLREAGDGGQRVSAGTFHLRGGDGEVELWAGVPLDEFPVLTVTLQDETAGPGAPGELVLSGCAPGADC